MGVAHVSVSGVAKTCDARARGTKKTERKLSRRERRVNVYLRRSFVARLPVAERKDVNGQGNARAKNGTNSRRREEETRMRRE